VADRLGRRLALVLFTVLAVIGYGVYFVAPRWEWVLVGTVLVMAWRSLTLPAVFAIIGDALPETQRAIGFGVQSMLKRVPIILAPPLGGALIAAAGFVGGMQIGLAITLALVLVAIGIVLQYYNEKERADPNDMGFREVWRRLHPSLKRLLITDCLALWAEGIPKVFIVLYVMNVLQLGAFDFGWLTGVQMPTAILIYIPIAKLADRMNRKPFVLLTFVFFALFPLVLTNATSLTLVTAAFVIAGLREVGEPARKALIVDLAHATTRAAPLACITSYAGSWSFRPPSAAAGFGRSTLGCRFTWLSASAW
jgi:MFS family permease